MIDTNIPFSGDEKPNGPLPSREDFIISEEGVRPCSVGANPEPKHTFATGANRSTGCAGDTGKFPARFDLISPVALRALAEVYGEGFLKYGAGNWKKGIPESSLLNHLEAHINHYKIYGYNPESEDDLAHALWNLFTLLHFRRIGRDDLMDVTGEIAVD